VREREPLTLSLVEVAGLVDGPAELWWERARQLRLVDNPKAVPMLVDAVQRGGAEGHRPDRRNIARAAATALGRIGSHEAVDALLDAELDLVVEGLRLARTPAALDAIARTGDYYTLEELGDPRAGSLAAEALRSRDGLGPQAAAAVVGRSGDAAYIPALLDAYAQADSDEDRLAFARALAGLGSPAGPDYVGRLARGDGPAAAAAREELRRLSRRQERTKRAR
jgi:HEAT repeat protein